MSNYADGRTAGQGDDFLIYIPCWCDMTCTNRKLRPYRLLRQYLYKDYHKCFISPRSILLPFRNKYCKKRFISFLY